MIRKLLAGSGVFLWLLPAVLLYAQDKPAGAKAAPISNDDCFACHDNLAPDRFHSSVHGRNLCTSCHNDIQELPHPEELKKVQCSSCHRLEAEVYNTSDHGMAVKSKIEAASCQTCHGDPHAIFDSRNPESPVYRLNIPKTCAHCHDDEKKMAPYNLLERLPLQSYSETVHGKALAKGVIQSAICTDCHGSHDLHSPANPKSKIFKRNIPSTCGKCHENVFKIYERSIHGKAALEGKREAPVCTDCHGEHMIKSRLDPSSLTFPTAISERVCGNCHAAERVTSKYRLPADRLKTYRESYHGLASKMGMLTVANCASCHGAHDVLPSSDPLSSVNKVNLPKTCGKCHPNVGEQLAKGYVHVSASPTSNQVIFYVTCFYVALIFLVIGGMVAHNFLDFRVKLREHYEELKRRGIYLRFTLAERAQHWILVLTFVVLAYTGFALKFPHAWWSSPFSFFEAGAEWRGRIHRIAAAVFCFLCFIHALTLVFTKRGRGQLKALLPRLEDVWDVLRMFRHYFDPSKPRPRFKRYGYIEKAEYWALVWGTLIMVLTGAMLTFENVTMRYLPKWFLDVATTIHFYEAVLATLAILVWHLYFTIFDPEQYPLNLSMMTGMSPEAPYEGKPPAPSPADKNEHAPPGKE
ncbi:MAG: cytochrome b/b6 domain-containing protein [Candidatus Omnitrophota bacterium]|jgi:predicted CXXCH cytochrome family protein